MAPLNVTAEEDVKFVPVMTTVCALELPTAYEGLSSSSAGIAFGLDTSVRMTPPHPRISAQKALTPITRTAISVNLFQEHFMRGILTLANPRIFTRVSAESLKQRTTDAGAKYLPLHVVCVVAEEN
jgi:hypothetical protein